MISQPPVSTTAALGTNATFSCRGAGSVLWQINGTQIRDASQVPNFESILVFVPLPRPSSSELIVTATEVTNATLEIMCVVDPGIGLGDLVRSDTVQLLVYGRYLCHDHDVSLVDGYSEKINAFKLPHIEYQHIIIFSVVPLIQIHLRRIFRLIQILSDSLHTVNSALLIIRYPLPND